MRMHQPTYSFPNMNSEVRLREMILYIATKCASDPTFGATKLNKILHRSDLRCFAQHGQPLTGVEYQALPNGPAPRRLVPVRTSMLERRDIVEEEHQAPGGQRQIRRIVARRTPDLSAFDAPQLAIVDEEIGALWGQRAIDASAASHGRAWRIARKSGDLIPYEAVFLGDDPLHSDDSARARELARQYGWR
jgi:hypothetical protein